MSNKEEVTHLPSLHPPSIKRLPRLHESQIRRQANNIRLIDRTTMDVKRVMQHHIPCLVIRSEPLPPPHARKAPRVLLEESPVHHVRVERRDPLFLRQRPRCLREPLFEFLPQRNGVLEIQQSPAVDGAVPQWDPSREHGGRAPAEEDLVVVHLRGLAARDVRAEQGALEEGGVVPAAEGLDEGLQHGMVGEGGIPGSGVRLDNTLLVLDVFPCEPESLAELSWGHPLVK